MPDIPTLALMICVALLVMTGVALLRVRGEAGRLRAEGQAMLRALEQARMAAEVARTQAEAEARLVDDRDTRLRDIAREIEGLRQSHRDAEGRCADAEARCAKATEAVARLEKVERELREDVAGVRRLLAEAQEGHARLSADHAALRADTDGKLVSAAREVEALKAIREEMTREFRDLAGRTLRETGAQFSEVNQQKLTELLTPFREQVGRFETELRAVHQEADKDRAVLAEQIRALSAQAQAVGQDAANLARALKGDKQRQGAWGEAQLERYLELMGYRRDVDYIVQAGVTGEEGERRRPDLVLRLPGEKALVIDSKVSLSAYAEAIASESEEDRERWLRLHARNVRDRIDELAERDYQGLVDGSIDMVMLFMPIEGAVSAAWAIDGELAAYAMSRGVGLVYPTSLLMALKTVRHLWNVEKRNRNAEAIAERAGRLYDKLATFMDSFARVGTALDDARKAHDKAFGQLTKGNGNLVRQVEMLKDLGARTGKSLGVAHDGEDAPEALPEEAQRVLPAAE
ncbi:DNA recombination protein RmuC [Rubellimicrobium rubrum]|uniref:DNA recombination protein RmuC homolog n=1 Tax=Rubellimicrobium rubrum TaxID=2585369 RepID=A0A5C4N4W8_9RHOB|nr:DNA recombination protein RmuC [Rubellimicrobium rubrum]TNC52068.1 DNA recombination protein RmuC [Rubellimicrobium rubrum]